MCLKKDVILIFEYLCFRPLEAELDEYHPKATRTLFVGNLERDISLAELRNTFIKFGDIIVSVVFL